MLSFFVFLSDVDMKNYISLCLQVALTLNTAAAAAAVAIVDLAQNGNSSANWLGICQQFGDFCQKASGAVVASFIAAGVLLFLIVISALALRKRWQINSYWSRFLDFASGLLWSRWWLTDERFFFSLYFYFLDIWWNCMNFLLYWDNLKWKISFCSVSRDNIIIWQFHLNVT